MAPITVKSGAGGANFLSGTNFWVSRVGFQTANGFYVVAFDNVAGTPKVHVYKADNASYATAFTEQDSANAPTINGGVTAAPSATYDGTRYLWGTYPTNADSLAGYLWIFDTQTNLYTVTSGTIAYSTVVKHAYPIRTAGIVGTAAFVFLTSNTDDIDLGIFQKIGAGGWGGSATSYLNLGASADVSIILDAGLDSSGLVWIIHQDGLNDDVAYKTMNSSGTLSAEVDINTTGPSSASTGLGGGVFEKADISGTDTIMAAYIANAGQLRARTIALESTANAANLGTETTVEATTSAVGTRTTATTAYRATTSTWYCAWWDDASSGTIFYSTLSGTTWTRSTFLTTVGRVVQIIPVGDGIGIFYMNAAGTDLIFDYLVTPTAPPIVISVPLVTASAAGAAPTVRDVIPGVLALASSAGLAPTILARVPGALATASALALAPTMKANVPGALATATALGLAPSLLLRIPGALATATALGLDPNVLVGPVTVAGAVLVATSAGLNPGLRTTVPGALATAAAAALNPSNRLTVPGALATASALFRDTAILIGPNTVVVTLATAAAAAYNPGLRSLVPAPVASGTAAAMLAPGPVSLIPAPVLAASALAFDPTVSSPTLILVDLATGSALALAPSLLLRVPGATMVASALAVSPNLQLRPVSPVLTAAASSPNPTPRIAVPGAVSTASAAAFNPSNRILIPGAPGTASALFLDSAVLIGPNVVAVPLMTAGADIPVVALRLAAAVSLATATAASGDPTLRLTAANSGAAEASASMPDVVYLIGPELIAVDLLSASALALDPSLRLRVNMPSPLLFQSGLRAGARIISEEGLFPDTAGDRTEEGLFWEPYGGILSEEPGGTNGNKAVRFTSNGTGGVYSLYSEAIAIPLPAYEAGRIARMRFDIRANKAVAGQTSGGNGAGYVWYDWTSYSEVPMPLTTDFEEVSFDFTPDGTRVYLDFWMGPARVPGDWIEISSLSVTYEDERLGIELRVPAPLLPADAALLPPSLEISATIIEVPVLVADSAAFAPALRLTVFIPAATAAAAGLDPSAALRVPGPVLPADGSAYAAALLSTVPATLATAEAELLDAQIALRASLPVATASGSFVAPRPFLVVVSDPATGSAVAYEPEVTAQQEHTLIDVSLMLGSAGGLAPLIRSTVPVVSAAGLATAFSPVTAFRVLPPVSSALITGYEPRLTATVFASTGEAEASFEVPSLGRLIGVPVLEAGGALFAPTGRVDIAVPVLTASGLMYEVIASGDILQELYPAGGGRTELLPGGRVIVVTSPGGDTQGAMAAGGRAVNIMPAGRRGE